MITDEKKREVAQKLREPKESLLAHPDEELIRLRYKTGCQRVQDIYEHLADLIDCPTCQDVGDGLTFRCSKCGCEFDMFDRDGEPTTWICDVPRLPNYCPNCGAKCGAEVI